MVLGWDLGGSAHTMGSGPDSTGAMGPMAWFSLKLGTLFPNLIRNQTQQNTLGALLIGRIRNGIG